MQKSMLLMLIKIVFGAYVLPGLILLYLTITLNLDIRQLIAFVIIYLIIVTAFNLFIVHKTSENCCSNTTTPTTTNEASTSTSPYADSPPPYQEVNKDPPPYTSLRYYWQMVHRSPLRWSSRSRDTKLDDPSPTCQTREEPITNPSAEYDPERGGGIKRSTSSPY